MQQKDAVPPGEGGQRFELDALREADDLKVAGVHFHDGRRLRGDRGSVILGAGPVGGSHLDHPGA